MKKIYKKGLFFNLYQDWNVQNNIDKWSINYAVKYYDLPKNPCTQAGSMGKGKAEEMNFWTQEEFEAFVEVVKDKPISYMAFKILYWTGCRLGDEHVIIRLKLDKPSKYAGLS